MFILYFFSCNEESVKDIVDHILFLEHSRTRTPHIFDKYIANKNDSVRLQVAKSIARIQDSVHVETLKKLLQDKNEKVIKKSIFALGQISGHDAVNQLTNLLENKNYTSYKRNIIQALGRTKEISVVNYLVSLLPSLPDSLKDSAIMSIAFLMPKKEKKYITYKLIGEYLHHPDEKIKTSAVYFFTRTPDSFIVKELIRTNFNNSSIGYKYKFKALSKILTRGMVQSDDTFIYDSLKIYLLHHISIDSISWQSKLYQISLLANFPDSLVLKNISAFLEQENPHLRSMAISTLEKLNLPETKNILLNYYNVADWQEKGEIIFTLAKIEPNLSYRFIQQNYDQGNTYFKQLLLRSLARINNSPALIQLRQFLTVPNVRLQYTAFNELVKLNRIKYDDAKSLLLSGDQALVVIAASWLKSNIQQSVLENLEKAYFNIKAGEGVDAKLAIVDVLESMNDRQSINFLKRIIEDTKSASLARRAGEVLSNLHLPVSVDTSLTDSLFIPKNIIRQDEPIQATITTVKGDIIVELLPSQAPLTVTNFVNLADKGFYNNTIFHRVVSDFVIQGGDPRADGWGGPGYHIPSECSELPFLRGSIGMATAGKDTGGSQFFICHSEQPHLTGHYTLFARVISGMNVVDNIEIEDKITKITIHRRGVS